jgi:hypothetical protein
MGETAPLARLTEASLALDPAARLNEAARNIWYVLGDVGVVDDARAHHWDVTPIHEAAHAVAYTLAEQDVAVVHYFPFGPVGDVLGYCRLVGERKGRRRPAVDLVRELGPNPAARDVVASFAGTVAEIRYDPRRAYGGFAGDRDTAEKMCKAFAELEWSDRYDLHGWAWAEACRMFQSQEVWAATIEVADRLKGSTSFNARVSGAIIRKTVAKHCPNGWAWSVPPLAEGLP